MGYLGFRGLGLEGRTSADLQPTCEEIVLNGLGYPGLDNSPVIP